jgi:hypothetical protein
MCQFSSKIQKGTAEMTKRATKTPRSASQTAGETLGDALDMLRRCTEHVKAMLDKGKYDIKLASHLAWCAEMLHKIALREQKQLEKLDAAALLERLRLMNRNERNHIALEIQRMDEGGRLFG